METAEMKLDTTKIQTIYLPISAALKFMEEYKDVYLFQIKPTSTCHTKLEITYEVEFTSQWI